MKKLWKKCSLVFLGICGAAVFAGGYWGSQITEKIKAQVARKEKILSYSVLSDIDSLDPQRMNRMDVSTIGYHIYEGLVRNEEGKIVPAGAKTWQISEDGLVYTFTLRKTCWEDGTLVTAKDYVRGIRRLAEKKTGSDYGFLVHTVKNGAAVQQGALKKEKLGVRTVGKDRIEIELEEKNEDFLSILSMVQFSPVKKGLAKEEGFGSSREAVLANGPFYVEEWGKGKLTLRKNEKYWNAGKVSVDKVFITKRESAGEAKKAYERGESNLLAMGEPIGEKASLYYDGQLVMVRLNTKKKKLSDRDFRKALSYAVDREKLNKELYDGMQSPTSGYVLPLLLKRKQGSVGYDENKAKSCMERAKERLNWNDKEPWKLTLTCADSEYRKQMAAFLKAEWERVLGIQVEVNCVTNDERMRLEAAGNFDMIVSSWIPDYDGPRAYLENWESDSPYNQGHFSSKEFDEKLKQAKKESGEERTKLFYEAEDKLKEEMPAIPLFFRRKYVAAQKGFEGVRIYFVGYQYNYIRGGSHD